MDIMEDSLPDPAAEFGELFEGQPAAFESELKLHAASSGDDDIVLSNGLDNDIDTDLTIQNHVDGGSVDDVENDEDSDVSSEGEPRIKIKVVKNVEYFANINIEKYLQKRGFKNEIHFSPKTIDKKSLSELIDPQLSRVNTIAFGPQYEAEHIVEAVDRFWRFYLWMKKSNKPMSLELKPMLIPMLLYFYHECFVSGLIPFSHKLCVDYSKKFLQEDKSKESYDILYAVTKVSSPKAFEEDRDLSFLSKREYRFVLSAWTYEKLYRFLALAKRPIMINLFTNRFTIVLKDSDDVIESVSEDSEPEHGECTKRSPVQEAIDKLRSCVGANLPTVAVYTTNGDPISGAISPKGTMIAYGMGLAGIRLCLTSTAQKMCDDTSPTEKDAEYKSPVQQINGHSGSVYDLSFHPMTKLLFSVGHDACMRAWDLNGETYKCRAVYRAHLGPIWSIDITKSGNMIVTGSMDTTARIWLPERIEYVRLLAGHYFDVDCVKFHPNEAYVATGSVDKSVRLWSISDGNMMRILTGSDGAVTSLAFHSNGKYIAGAGEDDKVYIWDLAEGEIVAELPSAHSCRDLAFCGNMLAGCFANQNVQIWNVRKIVGGDNYIPAYRENEEDCQQEHHDMENMVPETIPCRAKSLFSLYYKDFSTLYCLGADPEISSNNNFQTVSPTMEETPTDSIGSVHADTKPGFDKHTDIGLSEKIEILVNMNLDPNSTITLNACTDEGLASSSNINEDETTCNNLGASAVGSEDASAVGSIDTNAVGSIDAKAVGSVDTNSFVCIVASAVGSIDSSAVGSREASAVGSREASAVGSIDASAVGSIDASAVGSIDTSAVGSLVASAVGSIDASAVGSREGSAVDYVESSAVGSIDASSVGSIDASAVGSLNASAVSSIDTAAVGSKDASAVGYVHAGAVGSIDTSAVSCIDASAVGPIDASAIGSTDASAVGSFDASAVGSFDASAVGSFDASAVGSMDASAVGSMDASAVGPIDTNAVVPIDTSAVGSIDASAVGSIDASAHGSVDASAHGSIDASVIGSVDASAHGSIEASVVSSVDASAVGSLDAIAVGSIDASAVGSVGVNPGISSDVKTDIGADFMELDGITDIIDVDSNKIIDVTTGVDCGVDSSVNIHSDMDTSITTNVDVGVGSSVSTSSINIATTADGLTYSEVETGDIISADMDFDVDDQILQSFVEETLMLSKRK